MRKVVTVYSALLVICQVVSAADSDFKVATLVEESTLLAAMSEAPEDRVSDQPVVHVESAEGRLGIGVVHRPVIQAGAPVQGIQHHKQSEVYRVMAGKGILVTGTVMSEAAALDPEGYIVRELTGPSDVGIIVDADHEQVVQAGDIVIIPAGVAHGFREISEPITYMVVRVDPERVVALKPPGNM